MAASLGLIATTHAADDLTRPIAVSPEGHFLMTPGGDPFFWMGDVGWSVFTRLERDEATRYLQDRANKGFNVILAVAAGTPWDGLEVPNRHGERPFVDGNPAQPNERYFEHVDSVVSEAASHGIRFALLPIWGLTQVSRKELFTESSARAYGAWIARRYRGRGIIWVLGGDTNPVTLDPNKKGEFVSVVDRRPIYDALAAGIIEGDGGDPFITYHPTGLSRSGTAPPRTSLYFSDRPWLDMNMLQSSHFKDGAAFMQKARANFILDGTRNYQAITEEYRSLPVRPVVDGEPRFQDLAIDLDEAAAKGYWSGYDARNAAYHAVFAGAAGHTYGNHYVTQFYGAGGTSYEYELPNKKLQWHEALARPASGQMQYLKALMLSRPYFTRIPDQSLVIGEAGEGAAHIGATRDRDGDYAMFYLPHGQTVTVDLTKLAGTHLVGWWYDPRTGSATQIPGRIPRTITRSFTPSTSTEESDWVLVLDNEARNFPAPGATTDTRAQKHSVSATPINVILDTDMWSDIDDALALAMVHALQDRGELNLLAVTISSDENWCVSYVDLVNTFYGRPRIPIGIVRGGIDRQGFSRQRPNNEHSDANYTRVLSQRRNSNGSMVYPHDVVDATQAPEAISLLRKTLAAQPDGSLVLMQVGYSTNLARLLDSRPDSASALSGRDLIKRKVRLLSIMAGSFGEITFNGRTLAKGRPEFNLLMDVPSAQKLFSQWPTPLVASGYEIGFSMRYPARRIEQDYSYVADHPIAETYRRFAQQIGKWPHDHPTYDLTSVLYAARPDRGYFSLSKAGTVTVLEDGGTRFEESADGLHRHLILRDEQKARALEAMTMLVSQPPVRTPQP